MTRFIFLTFLIVSTVLPLFSFDGYSLVQNTTSHLGAQGSPFAWVMNIMFVALGIMNGGRQRVFGFIMAGIAIVFSLGMWVAPAYMGLLQRVMFISSFWWLFFYMKPDKRLQRRAK